MFVYVTTSKSNIWFLSQTIASSYGVVISNSGVTIYIASVWGTKGKFNYYIENYQVYFFVFSYDMILKCSNALLVACSIYPLPQFAFLFNLQTKMIFNFWHYPPQHWKSRNTNS